MRENLKRKPPLVGIAPTEDKRRENRLRWFKQVYHRSVDAVVRINNIVMINGSTVDQNRPMFLRYFRTRYHQIRTQWRQ